MVNLHEQHEKMLLEVPSIAPEIISSPGYRIFGEKVELKEQLEKMYRLTRRKIAPELTGVFSIEPDVCGVETVSRCGLVAKRHAPWKVVAS